MQDPTELKGEFVTQETAESANAKLLREYEHLKFYLASLIRTASSYADKDADELRREYRALQRKLAEDRFYLTVVGQSSRGKSTLINALVGMDRLPTGIVPITSVITSVGYGSKEIVMVYSFGHSWGLDVPLAELPDYITEQGNPGNQQHVDVVEIQLPAEILRRGFYLVDTPGFGSAIFENTLTTRKFLPKADAFIFVTSFDAPFSAEELAFFREAQSRGRKVFVAVNKSDLVSSQQHKDVLSFLRQRLANQCDLNGLTFFPLSARDALVAKLNHDPEKLAGSGLPALETALVSFLTEEKAYELLVQTAEALEIILTGQSNPTLRAIRKRLHELRAKIGARRFGDSSPAQESASGRTFQVRPCFVCAATVDAVFRFLSQYQYELWRSIEEQETHAERNGFCVFHTWQYASIASPQGICGAYPKLLLSLAESLSSIAQNSPHANMRGSVDDLFSNSKRCKMCDTEQNAEKSAIAEFIARFNRSKGAGENWNLCLPHLRRVLGEISNNDTGQRLVLGMSRALQHIAEDMQRFALRHEGLRRDLASDEEFHAAESGITILAGHRNLVPGAR